LIINFIPVFLFSLMSRITLILKKLWNSGAASKNGYTSCLENPNSACFHIAIATMRFKTAVNHKCNPATWPLSVHLSLKAASMPSLCSMIESFKAMDNLNLSGIISLFGDKYFTLCFLTCCDIITNDYDLQRDILFDNIDFFPHSCQGFWIDTRELGWMTSTGRKGWTFRSKINGINIHPSEYDKLRNL
jgi:hypothetical protein